MSNTRPSVGPFTSSHSFAAVDCYGGPDLLEVRAGVPAATALLEASAILESCKTLAVAITSEADGQSGSYAYAIWTMVRLVKGLIDSIDIPAESDAKEPIAA